MAQSREVVEAFAMEIVASPELSQNCVVCVLHTWPGRPSRVLAPECRSKPPRQEEAPDVDFVDGCRFESACVAPFKGCGTGVTQAQALPGTIVAKAGRVTALAEPSSRPPQDPHIEPQVVKAAALGKMVILVPCTFEDEREIVAARQLMPILKSEASPVRVLMVQLFSVCDSPGPQKNEMLLRRHEAMLSTAPHGVLLNPPLEPSALQDAIQIQFAVEEQNERRMEGALDAAVPAISQEEIANLRQEQERILWNEIPSVFMLQLPHANPNLQEGIDRVEDITFLRRLAGRAGIVYEASRMGTQERFALKVIEKDSVTSPGMLEGHYRELILLSRTLDHEHICKCVEVLHSPTRLYYVLRFAGNRNLAQVLESRTDWRLPETEAVECFSQLCTALAYCHERNVAVRDLAIEHVVMRPGKAEGFSHWTLVDFRSALITQGNNTSSVICGGLPCMAPEVMAGQNYIPRLADRWSLGMLLLEVSGGLGTLDAAVHWLSSAVDGSLAARIMAFFREEGSHAKCFSLMNRAPPGPAILEPLEALLLPAPDDRGNLSHLAALVEGEPPGAAA